MSRSTPTGHFAPVCPTCHVVGERPLFQHCRRPQRRLRSAAIPFVRRTDEVRGSPLADEGLGVRGWTDRLVVCRPRLPACVFPAHAGRVQSTRRTQRDFSSEFSSASAAGRSRRKRTGLEISPRPYFVCRRYSPQSRSLSATGLTCAQINAPKRVVLPIHPVPYIREETAVGRHAGLPVALGSPFAKCRGELVCSVVGLFSGNRSQATSSRVTPSPSSTKSLPRADAGV